MALARDDKLIPENSRSPVRSGRMPHAQPSGLQIAVDVPRSKAMMKLLFQGACGMFLAVALGAFGAHALEPRLQAAGHVETWKTAVFYHALHALALLAVGIWQALDRRAATDVWVRAAGVLWLAGLLGFSVSLYGYSLGGPRWLVFITPLGGMCLLAGWAALATAAWRRGRNADPVG